MKQKLQPEELDWSRAETQFAPTSGSHKVAASPVQTGLEKLDAEANEPTDIEAFVRSLRSDSAVRAIALEVLDGKPVNDIQPLLDSLGDSAPHRWKECAVAAWALGRSTSLPELQRRSVTQRLCQILGKEELQLRKPLAERFRRRFVNSIPASGTFGLLITLAFLVASLRNHITMEHGLRFVFAGILGTLVYAIVCSPVSLALSITYDHKRIDRIRASAAEALGNLRSTNSLDVLAVSAVDGSRSVREAAREALHKLLPTITQVQYGRLATKTVPSLCSTLRDAEEPLCLAILGAFKFIGDTNAISTVSRLMAQGKTARVRAAASELLPILQLRRDEENAPTVLLRASQSTPLSPEVLLRPIVGPAATVENQLLRAGSASEEAR